MCIEKNVILNFRGLSHLRDKTNPGKGVISGKKGPLRLEGAMKNWRERGFTLLEVMVVVAIIGILSTIAYPSYTDYIIRGRIPEGLTLLANERIVAEKFFMDNRLYKGTPAGRTTPVDVCGRYPVSTRYFVVTCAATSNTDTPPNTYLLTANGQNGMAGFSYTIDETGARRTTGVGGSWHAKPWVATLPKGCWILKGDGSC